MQIIKKLILCILLCSSSLTSMSCANLKKISTGFINRIKKHDEKLFCLCTTMVFPLLWAYLAKLSSRTNN